jgi:DNA transformation protein
MVKFMSKDYAQYVLDLLSPYGSMTSRAMFGGYGIYKDGLIVGIIVDDELYFKVDESVKKKYEELGSVPFTYNRGDKIFAMPYWKVPIDIMENEDELENWLEGAYRVSMYSKKSKERS